MSGELKIFSGNANPALAHEICAYLGTKLGEATVGSFSDGEIRVKIEENVRGGDIFVVQSSCQPVNDSLMELLIIIDALKRSSANRITAVIPEKTDQQANRKKKGSAGGRPVGFDADRYKQRNTVERCFQKIKTWRGLATRYDKSPESYEAGLHLRGSIMWLKLLTSTT